MTLYVLVIIASSVFANFVTHWFAPLITLKTRLGSFGRTAVLNCAKCFGFWMGFPVGFLTSFPDPLLGAILTPFILSFTSYIVFGIIDLIDSD